MPQEHPADAPRREWLRVQLMTLEDEQVQMLEQDRVSWQALVASRRLALQYRNELDNLDADLAPDEAPASLEEVVALVLTFPDAVIGHLFVLQRLAKVLTIDAAVTLLGMLPDEVFKRPEVARRCS